MSLKAKLFTPKERHMLEHTFLVRHRLEEQYADLEQQHETAVFGMWVFLGTEVMFFSALFLGVVVYRSLYPVAVEAASERLNWLIGGINTVVLLMSSLTMVLAVHYAKLGQRKALLTCLALTALLGVGFLGLKGLEYYDDYVENLIPGWRFDPEEWMSKEKLTPPQVSQAQLFLLYYWIMTGFHAVHMTIGIAAVTVLLILAWRGHFSPTYYTPVDATALYWHFVDMVWIFLYPMLYLLGTHTL
jgi:cytochrome c oxidase subunit 3